MTVAPTRISSPSRRSTSARSRAAASSGLSPAAPAAVSHAVHVGPVEAAQVPQPRQRGIHLEEEVVPRRRRVARGEARVAVRGAAEEEGVVAREVEALATDRPGGDDEADRAGHRAPVRL